MFLLLLLLSYTLRLTFNSLNLTVTCTNHQQLLLLLLRVHFRQNKKKKTPTEPDVKLQIESTIKDTPHSQSQSQLEEGPFLFPKSRMVSKTMCSPITHQLPIIIFSKKGFCHFFLELQDAFFQHVFESLDKLLLLAASYLTFARGEEEGVMEICGVGVVGGDK